MGRTQRRRAKRILQSRPVNVGCEFRNLYKLMAEHQWEAVAKLTPAIFAKTGRGLMSLQPIEANSLIIKIPLSLLITRKTVLEKIPELNSRNLTSAELLTLYLLICKTRGKNSIYLSTLPQEFSVGALCTTEEVACLPRNLQGLLMDHQEYLLQKYRKLKALWMTLFKDLLDFDLFKWAWFCVNTRAIFFQDMGDGKTVPMMSSPEQNMALAPYLDLFNHSPEVNIQASFNQASQCYEIRTISRIGKFDQVFINYGPHDNEKLFLEYGFIIPGNPHSSVKIGLENIMSLASSSSCVSSKQLSLHQQLLSRNQLYCSRDGLSWDTFLFLAILCLEDSELSRYNFPYEICCPDNAQTKMMGNAGILIFFFLM